MSRAASRPPTRRCALYTRKSSEEGLDQDFNSLDAQREACAAYVTSQSSEGWTALPALYDDGGYSGGTMERPALQRLLGDTMAGRIYIVVVYKIDRLTRSLADFARIVEIFERHEVSFVSVTQSFNTTSSMGQLTLNMLLSFAQFEREITGERTRDKIAASKKKGLWMGGTLPLGYDLPAESSRVLVVNPGEADFVRRIFSAYLDLGSVHALEQHLRQSGIVSKARTTAASRQLGGKPFSRGALFHLLRNRLYLGEMPHRDTTYPGQHAAIVDRDLFEAVQARVETNTRRRRRSRDRAVASPLTGRIFDTDGRPMSPTFAYGRNRKLYRYCVSADLQQGGPRAAQDGRAPAPRRISADVLETLLEKTLNRLLPDQSSDALPLVSRIEVHRAHLDLTLPIRLLRTIRRHLGVGETAEPDPVLIRALRNAHQMLEVAADGAPAHPRGSPGLSLPPPAHPPGLPRPRSAGRHPGRPSTVRDGPRRADGCGLAAFLVRAAAQVRRATHRLRPVAHDPASLLLTENHLISALQSPCSCARIACLRPEQESGISDPKLLESHDLQRDAPESPLAGACFWQGFGENSLLSANSPSIRASRDRAAQRPTNAAKGRFERARGLGNAPEKVPVTATCVVAQRSETNFECGWRRDRDSNPGDGFPPTRFPGVRLRPLGHLSVAAF